MELLPKLRELSHLEVHVFTILSIFANFSRKPLGLVELSMTEIAREVGIRRSSLYRTLSALERTGLVETVSSGDTKRLLMRHYLPDVSPHETPPVSSGDAEAAGAPKESTSCKAPRRSEEVSEEVTEAVAAGNGHKKPRRRPSWLIWNSDEERLEARKEEEFQKRRDEFMTLWFERLGNEEAFYEQLSEADKWLKRHPDRRGKVKRFDMFFGKWLDRCLEG